MKISYGNNTNIFIFNRNNLKVINMIDKSDVKPTKKLTNVIHNMLQSKKEFTLLDEQKVIMEEINNIVLNAYKSIKKQVII